MAFRIRSLVYLVVLGAAANLFSIRGFPAHHLLHFFVYLAAVLFSSGMKVGLPSGEGTMSVNFPFVLLAILQLSPLQAVGLAVFSVLAQSGFRGLKAITLPKALFSLANVATATVLAWRGYQFMMQFHLEIAPALAIAAVIYFFANTIPSALIVGPFMSPISVSESSSPFFKQWQKEFLWCVPFYLASAMLAALANLIGQTFGWTTSLMLVPLVYTLYRTYSSQMAAMRDRDQHAIDTEALHLRTIEGLAMAIEAKDQSTHAHLLRVRVYVAELGKSMALDPLVMQALRTAAFLHDIGKLAVPEHIINKPGKLTPEEFDKMKIHPAVGADILERVRFPYPVVPIVRSHHEAWDGSGYPDGLKGEEIPIGARLLTVVDCFDALASERPYRKALPLDEAMAHIQSKSGTQFDPAIVELLSHRYLELEELSRRQIHKMEPLNTDLRVERGAAPGAGFEPIHSDPQLPVPRITTTTPAAPFRTARPALIPHYARSNKRSAVNLKQMAVCELAGRLEDSVNFLEAGSILSTELECLVPHQCLAIYRKSGEALIPIFLAGPCSDGFSKSHIPLGQGLSGWVAHNGRTIVNGNPTVEPNYIVSTGLFTAASSAISIPLLDKQGVIVAALTLYSIEIAAFSKEHLRILQQIEPRLSLLVQNEPRKPIAQQSFYDIPHVGEVLLTLEGLGRVQASA